jgi:hypothetical protein
MCDFNDYICVILMTVYVWFWWLYMYDLNDYICMILMTIYVIYALVTCTCIKNNRLLRLYPWINSGVYIHVVYTSIKKSWLWPTWSFWYMLCIYAKYAFTYARRHMHAYIRVCRHIHTYIMARCYQTTFWWQNSSLCTYVYTHACIPYSPI